MSDKQEQPAGAGETTLARSEYIDLPAVSDRGDPDRASGKTGSDSTRLIRGARLVGNPATSPVSIEQYRRLAAVMHHAQVERGIKTAMVASAFSGEGKTLTSANLALTLSESYRRRVLLIDADLRRPALHDVFQLPNLEGLSDGLRSKTLRRMPLIEITPHLSLVPGGRPDSDPMGGLTSERMKHVMRQASERFDWVILDTPPVVVLPDGSLIAAMVDTVLLVVAAGRTPFHAIQRAVNQIGREKIIGTLLNFVDAEAIAPSLQAYSYHDRYTTTSASRQLEA